MTFSASVRRPLGVAMSVAFAACGGATGPSATSSSRASNGSGVSSGASGSTSSSGATGIPSTTASSGSSSGASGSAATGSTTGGTATAACAAADNFRATATSSAAISLAWTGGAGVTATLSSKSYCGTDSYTTLATLPAGATSYTDTTVNAGWAYWFELATTDGQGHTALAVISAAAGAGEAAGCSGGASPQPSGVVASCQTMGTTGTTGSGSSGGTAAATTSTSNGGTTTGGGLIVPGFYVATNGDDSNAGTVAAPFATLARAQAAMQGSATLKTTYLRAGRYLLPTLNCGSGTTCGLNLSSADDGETWSYYPPDGVDSADLNAGSTAANNGLVIALSVSASNVTINGLTIHNFAYAGIGSGGGANNLLIENNLLFNGFVATNNSNPGAISFYGAANTTISHNVIHDIAMFGVSVSNVNGNISNLLVTGNVVYNTCTANADCGALYVQDVTTTATNLRFTNNYVHDGNTFAALGSNYGAAIYADDCTSNVTESGNVLTGRNGSNTLMIHGGSNIHQTGNLTDLATFGQHVAVYQTSGVTACASATMSGNQYENNLVIGAGGGGGFALLSGSPKSTPTIANNDYYSYGSSPISSGTGAYRDTSPVNIDPQLSGWAYTLAPGSPVFGAPVNFPPLVGGWGPPGYSLPQTGTPPSSP